MSTEDCFLGDNWLLQPYTSKQIPSRWPQAQIHMSLYISKGMLSTQQQMGGDQDFLASPVTDAQLEHMPYHNMNLHIWEALYLSNISISHAVYF